jgi:hypothetical protein
VRAVFLSSTYSIFNNSTFNPTPTTQNIKMSAEYQGQDPIKLATQAEQDLNSHAAKTGKGGSDSSKSFENPSLKLVVGRQAHYTFKSFDNLRQLTNLVSTANESGVDESVSNKFPGAEVTIGGTGASNNVSIPESEGGDINPSTGKLYKAGDFEGAGGKLTPKS